MNVIFVLTKLGLTSWLKLKEKLFAPPATSKGVSPGVVLTPPTVFTHVTPHVTSKVSDGLVADDPTTRTTTSTLVESGLAMMAVQV